MTRSLRGVSVAVCLLAATGLARGGDQGGGPRAPAKPPVTYVGMKVGLTQPELARKTKLPRELTKLLEVHDARGMNAVAARRGADVFLLAVSAEGVVTDELVLRPFPARASLASGCELGDAPVLVGLLAERVCDKPVTAERAWNVVGGKWVAVAGIVTCVVPCL